MMGERVFNNARYVCRRIITGCGLVGTITYTGIVLRVPGGEPGTCAEREREWRFDFDKTLKQVYLQSRRDDGRGGVYAYYIM